jgi:hypothetical protein
MDVRKLIQKILNAFLSGLIGDFRTLLLAVNARMKNNDTNIGRVDLSFKGGKIYTK